MPIAAVQTEQNNSFQVYLQLLSIVFMYLSRYIYALFEYFLCFSKDIETNFANFCEADLVVVSKKNILFFLFRSVIGHV